MIPRSEILRVAEEQGLLATTIEKDYALGWLLFGISAHSQLQAWVFKGGTCLKKCYFDTYRFSEDLDFTLPASAPYDSDAIISSLVDVARWVETASGIAIPADGIDIEQLRNKRGEVTFQARVSFQGPLGLASRQRQRIKFDLTRDEIVVGPVQRRPVFHGYSDRPEPVPEVQCYSLDEIVAEKSRALVQRSGRARDVYDVVNIARNFPSEVSVGRVRDIAAKKFEFKGIAAPTVEGIMASIDPAVLQVDWQNALRHQLQALPPVGESLEALKGALEWVFAPERPVVPLRPVPAKVDEAPVPRPRFLGETLGVGVPVATRRALRANASRLESLRFAARNRLMAEVTYHGVQRLVEPYSLRLPDTGNLLLYVHEVRRGTGRGEGIKSFKVDEIGSVKVTEQSFSPRYRIEL
ncbi:MAG: nucleotidyl transferase AbiEii/AbiGii toxin family protein [Gemmatimonadales bacterium]|nr:nucleotidyl transferase AbiEii/AbiGii toxin family protein [Gemmatimonadales bacterium]